jgi:hypothetical protein
MAHAERRVPRRLGVGAGQPGSGGNGTTCSTRRRSGANWSSRRTQLNLGINHYRVAKRASEPTTSRPSVSGAARCGCQRSARCGGRLCQVFLALGRGLPVGWCARATLPRQSRKSRVWRSAGGRHRGSPVVQGSSALAPYRAASGRCPRARREWCSICRVSGSARSHRAITETQACSKSYQRRRHRQG